MRGRAPYLVAGAAVAALTAGSVGAVAATRGVHTSAYGMHAATTSSSTCTVPALPGQHVTVMLSDMRGTSMMGGGMMGDGMMGGRMMLRAVPATVSAGTVSLIALNHGTRVHELVVLPLADGAAVGQRAVRSDRTVDESGSLGEASRSCGAAAGNGLRVGSAGWVTLTLQPGRYELLCNLPGHYAAGMYAELDVV